MLPFAVLGGMVYLAEHGRGQGDGRAKHGAAVSP
jgi:hypothetical protein